MKVGIRPSDLYQPATARGGPPQWSKHDTTEAALKALAVFPGSREVKVAERDVPALVDPDQVLLRVRDVGICGTDREICSFEYGTPPPGDDHLVIGHEALAEVVEVGPGVERARPGDLVVPTVRRPCPRADCLPCRSGHQDFCVTGDFTERGIKGAHGFIAEYIVEKEPNLVRVPAALEGLAVLAEPLTIAEKAMAQVIWLMQHRPPWLAPETPPERRGRGLCAVVLGAGPVGILGSMTLAVNGFETYVYSRELPPTPRTELVSAMGATYVSTQTLSPPELAAGVGNIDVIYEAVGHSHFALEVLKVLGHNGIYVLTGIPGIQAFVQADPASLMRQLVLKNQILLGTVNAGPDDFAGAVGHLAEFEREWPEATRTLIGGRYPLDQAAELIFARPSGIKTVISF